MEAVGPTGAVVRLAADQVLQAQTDYPDLELVVEAGRIVARGEVRFQVEYDGRVFKDAYQVELEFLHDYPDSVPLAREVGGEVPDGFHKNPGNTLCLSVPVEVARVFAADRTVLGFINRLVVPYLFSYSYHRAHGQMPHGELPHGAFGLIEYYKRFFDTDALSAMKFIKLLADASAPPLMACPCRSRRKLGECHGPRLDELRPYLSPSDFEAELHEVVALFKAAGCALPESAVTPKRVLRNRRRRRRRSRQRRRR